MIRNYYYVLCLWWFNIRRDKRGEKKEWAEHKNKKRTEKTMKISITLYINLMHFDFEYFACRSSAVDMGKQLTVFLSTSLENHVIKCQ